MKSQRGLSIVELLVITAIIVVLGAVLVPVFRQASPAQGEEQSFRNIGQLERAMLVYDADFDQHRGGRQFVDNTHCESWRQVIDPYVRHQESLLDIGNPATKFLDAFSDPAARTMICPAGTGSLDGLRKHHRGFYWNNIFGARSGGAYFDNAGLSLSEVSKPERVGDLVEGKQYFTDQGPFSMWAENVDAETSWLGGASPVTGLKWNLSGDHYRGWGMNASFIDGHTRFVAYDGLCDPWIKVVGTTGIVTHPKYETFWNFSENDISALGSGFGWMQAAVEQYCLSYPERKGRPGRP